MAAGAAVFEKPAAAAPLPVTFGSFQKRLNFSIGNFDASDVFREGAENRTRGGCAPQQLRSSGSTPNVQGQPASPSADV
jgi:hypothetical protein